MRIRIVDKKRFIAFLTVVILLVMTFGSLIVSKNNKVYAKTEDKYIEYTVKSGDTLWSIASEHNYYNKDVREVIYDIKSLNNISSNEFLTPGEVLIIDLN